MQMGMMEQILPLKNGKEADGGAEMFGIGRNGLQRLGRGPAENAVEYDAIRAARFACSTTRDILYWPFVHAAEARRRIPNGSSARPAR